ncbi:hypothetical protein RZS08_27625 [Arthrospira platensis SPKY1]|nr:hypothetical protein [Arthrospira platensis SPKY1]
MDYEQLLEVIDEKIDEFKVYLQDDLRYENYGQAAGTVGFVDGLTFVKETIERWQMETAR